MSRINLRRMVVRNFRTLKGEHEVELGDNGLVILRGPSGVGKTNILLALAYAFGYCPWSSKDLQCWYTEEAMSVEVHMDTDRGPAILTRGDKLTLQIAEKKYKGSVKSVEDELDKLCGVNYRLREYLTYRDQYNPKKFLTMGDTELKKFLTQVLGLEGMEKEIDASVKRLTPLEKQADLDAAAVLTHKTDYDRRLLEMPAVSSPTSTDALKQKIIDLTYQRTAISKEKASLDEQLALQRESEVHVVQLAVEKLDASIAALRAPRALPATPALDNLNILLVKAREHHAAALEKDKDRLHEWEIKSKALQMDLRHLHNELARIPGLKSEISRLEHQADKLNQDLCPTCDRIWDNAFASRTDILFKVKNLQDELEAIKSHRPAVAALEAELAERKFEFDPKVAKLEKVLAKLETNIAVEKQRLRNEQLVAEAEVKVQVANLISQRSQIEAKIDRPSLRTAEAIVALTRKSIEVKEQRREVEHELEMVEQQNRAKERELEQAKERLEKAKHRLALVSVEANKSRALWQKESDYLDLLRGFRNKIFDEVLEAISLEASNVIAGLPNSQDMSIEFRSERETGAGTTKQEIKPVVFIHGEERTLLSSVSGGQLTSIELAVDLAVVQVISARHGCNLNWLVLDETFDGHDVATKEACLTLLQQHAANKLLLIVDHSSEFKEMFQREIVVEQDGKLSKIKESA